MSKYLPHGTQVIFNSETIGGLVSVTIPERTRGEGETTDTDSSAREYIPGLREGGDLVITFRHDPTDTGQAELETNYDTDGNAAKQTVEIHLPSDAGSPGTYTFDGYVSRAPSGELNTAEDEAATLTATIKVGSAVTIS